MILKPRLFRKPRKGYWATKGLVGFWPFYEGSGNKVLDLSGNNNTGTFSGDVSWVSGKHGSAVYFAGDTDYISIGDKPTLEGMSQLTVIAGVKPTDCTGQQIVIGKDSSWILEVYSERMRFRTWTGGGEVSIFSNVNTLLDGVWTHIAGVYDGANNHTYVNGIYNLSGAQTGIINSNPAPIAIGTYGSVPSALEFLGSMSYVMIYNRALSLSEIALLYQKPFCMFERDPIELWSAATLGAAPPVGIPILRRRIEAA